MEQQLNLNDPFLGLSEEVAKKLLDDYGGERETKKDEKSKKETLSQKLIRLGCEYNLFHDDTKEAFAFVNNICMKVRSSSFKQNLCRELWEREGKSANSDSLNQALNTLEGKALYDGKCNPLHNRVAELDGSFYYDLGAGHVVKINKRGWQITNQTRPLFKSYSHQQKQVMPVAGGNIQNLFKYLNIQTERDKLLSLTYLISCFVPGIPLPVFHPHGSQGAGKTVLFSVYKKLADPSKMDVIITPQNHEQVIQVLDHHRMPLFDNLNGVPVWLSDLLSQACTGAGFSKRKLYSDDEDVIFNIMRPIGLNGINLLVCRADLMDRTILLKLDRISQIRQQERNTVLKDFENERPYILGGIFDALSRAMGIYPSVKLETLPRMADFMRWGTAIAQALGHDKQQFIDAYQKNVESQNEEVVNNNTLAQAVLRLMEHKEEWRGTVKEAYDELAELVTLEKRDYSFPRASNKLRNHLERIKPNLIDYGIEFRFDGFSRKKGIPITFQKVLKLSSPPPVSSPPLKNKGYSGEDTVNIPEVSSPLCSPRSPSKIKGCEHGERSEDKNRTFWKANNGQSNGKKKASAEKPKNNEGRIVI